MKTTQVTIEARAKGTADHSTMLSGGRKPRNYPAHRDGILPIIGNCINQFKNSSSLRG